MEEVFITALKVTSEDDWLKEWTRLNGDGVFASPQFRYLEGKYKPMLEWMTFRKLPLNYLTKSLMDTLIDLIENGQKEPIKIYQDMRIVDGHKRAACFLFLGKNKIKAIVVPDDYKL